MKLALGMALLVLALVVIALVLFQSGKDKKLSGTIAGGAETFFGKSKGSDVSKKLSVVTAIVAVLFTILVVVAYIVL